MEKEKFPKTKKVTIAIQKHNIKRKFKDLIVKDISKMDINMLLKIQPHINSKEYIVWLKYESLNRKPKVYLETGQLNINEKQDIPHKYGIKEMNGKEYVELCLFHKNEWDSTMNISDTIIPWTCEWLYFYEIWVITGKWCGGGKHPTPRDINKNAKS